MQLIPIQTPILKQGDDLASVLIEHASIEDGDIIVISSKAIATVEGAAIKLDEVEVSAEAQKLAADHNKPAAYYQVVLNETKRMNGSVIQSVHGIVLTELKPDGLTEGSILVPNAGLDRSNVAEGYVIGWPKDPVQSLRLLRSTLLRSFGATEGQVLQKSSDHDLALVLTDSGLSPRRKGVTSFALATAGIDPFLSMIGAPDLFGQDLKVTEEAVADQLATAANFLMGNTNQSTPAVIVRDHGVTLSDYEGWVPGIEREKDIYHGVI